MMAGDGLAKLIEECGELLQVAGKKLEYYSTDVHPDGGPRLDERLEDEIADVIAACTLVRGLHRLDVNRIHARATAKLALFEEWAADPTNNTHGIDARPRPRDPAPACIFSSECSRAPSFRQVRGGCYVCAEHAPDLMRQSSQDTLVPL